MDTQVIARIADVEAGSWNALLPDRDYPFLRHEFLHALESSGCVSRSTGWQPAHLLLKYQHQLRAAVPLYIKFHSFGEFVFDWSWADAYRRAGLDYYPKLLNAVPFTPATGPRLLAVDSEAREQAAAAVRKLTARNGLSSAHALFTNRQDSQTFQQAGFLSRQDCQYHWFNRSYVQFEDFLASLNSKRRKEIRRERRRVAQAGISVTAYRADELSAHDWEWVFQLYASTYHMRGQAPYLNLDFFLQLRSTMPHSVIVFTAKNSEDDIVAAAITLRGDRTLYGRHWGADANYHSLHFETCYYQGIDYCIGNGLKRFDAGAQGEHKLSRGFIPVDTHSYHWIGDPRFRDAVADFLTREGELMVDHRAHQQTREPFRQGSGNG